MNMEKINAVLESMLEKATCTKRAVGAVVVLDGEIISSGYNGPPEQFKEYCNPCPRLESKSGMDMDICPAIHAEMRAILNAHRDVRGGTLYITCGLPCKDCMKEIIVAGIVKIASPYPLNIYIRDDGFDGGETYNFNLAYAMMVAAGIVYQHDSCLTKGSTTHTYEREVKVIDERESIIVRIVDL